MHDLVIWICTIASLLALVFYFIDRGTDNGTPSWLLLALSIIGFSFASYMYMTEEKPKPVQVNLIKYHSILEEADNELRKTSPNYAAALTLYNKAYKIGHEEKNINTIKAKQGIQRCQSEIKKLQTKKQEEQKIETSEKSLPISVRYASLLEDADNELRKISPNYIFAKYLYEKSLEVGKEDPKINLNKSRQGVIKCEKELLAQKTKEIKNGKTDSFESRGISGQWKESVIHRMLMDKLTKFGGPKDFGLGGCLKCKPEHSLYRFYPIERGRDVFYVGFYITKNDGYDCFACGVALSVFEFKKVDGGWLLTNESIGKINLGAYGELNEFIKTSISITPISDKYYSIKVSSHYSRMGDKSGQIKLYIFIKNYLKEVLWESYYYDNFDSGRDKKEQVISDISIKENNSGFYDIHVKSKGYRGNENIDKKVIYKFDMKKYTYVEAK